MAELPDKIGRDESAEIGRRRKLRNWGLFVALAVLAGLFYAMTIVKLMSPHV
jgi:hypothetical protein